MVLVIFFELKTGVESFDTLIGYEKLKVVLFHMSKGLIVHRSEHDILLTVHESAR